MYCRCALSVELSQGPLKRPLELNKNLSNSLKDLEPLNNPGIPPIYTLNPIHDLNSLKNAWSIKQTWTH